MGSNISSWSPAEDAMLAGLAGKMIAAEIAAEITAEFGITRTLQAVKKRAYVLNIPLVLNEPAWTKAEIDLLLEYAPRWAEVSELLNRTPNACALRHRRLVSVQKAREIGSEMQEVESSRDPSDYVRRAYDKANEIAVLKSRYPGQSYRNLNIKPSGLLPRSHSRSVPAMTLTGSSAAMCAE